MKVAIARSLLTSLCLHALPPSLYLVTLAPTLSWSESSLLSSPQAYSWRPWPSWELGASAVYPACICFLFPCPPPALLSQIAQG